ncbi:MAG: antibiotic biosynthesis monooxygenase [Marmoricola sp.]|nr:antibiotic biosynthesis monooxygenase [Marmoricola sp.]
MRIIVKWLWSSPSTTSLAPVLVVNRFRSAGDDVSIRSDLEGALALLSAQTGCEDARLGRNLDDPGLWVMVTRWTNVGSYRRALSSYDVKAGAVPILSRAIDEASAYEPVEGELNEALPRTFE